MKETSDRRLPVRAAITFHGIGRPRGPRASWPYWVSHSSFLRLLDEIAEESSAAVEITFDDGFSSDAELAMPALLARGLTASFFVSVGMLDKPGYLTSSQVSELAKQGMTIGVHGWEHRSWRHLADGELSKELFESRDSLRPLLGKDPLVYACPFGQFDQRVLYWLRKAGAEVVFTSDAFTPLWCGWIRPRFTMTENNLYWDRRSWMRSVGGVIQRVKSECKKWR